MSSLKQQRSWHEDFTRNLFRLFSRSKSVDQDKPENSEEHEDESTTSRSDESDFPPTPERHLTTEPTAQTLDRSSQDGLDEADSECDPEGSVQDDAERDPHPVTPPAPEPSSPAPPVDGFFRRLGSLFLFSRAEPGGADRQSQSGSESEVPGSEWAQDTDPETLPTGARVSQTSVEGEEQPLEDPQSLSRSLKPDNSGAGPEVKATLHSEQDTLDAQLHEEEQAKEDEENPVEGPSDEEKERRRALASPPVVTHVRYRGLRKMKKQHGVRLSSTSEGEEGQCGSSLSMSASEEEETQQLGASAGSPCLADSRERPSVQPFPETSSPLDLPQSSNTLSSTHIPAETKGTDSALSPSALQTHTMARTQSTDSESDPTLTPSTFCPGENDPTLLVDSLEADTDGEAQADKLQASASDSTPLGALDIDALMNPLETSHTQLFDTATNSDTHLIDTNTASNPHTCIIGSDVPSNCFQESQLSGSRQDGRSSKENQDYLSVKAEISGHDSSKAELAWEDGTTQLETIEDQPGLDEETLQLESKKMVDDILKNALASLEKIDASERDMETPLGDELNEGSETPILMGQGDSVDDSVKLTFREHSPVQAGENPQLNLSDETLSGRLQADGCRSTPSSGYESIAGSDTDIRSMAMSADFTLSSGPITTHCTEPEFREKAGIVCCTEERELCPEGNSLCQNSVQSAFLHDMNLEDREGPSRTETNNELLFQNGLNDSNISHKTNITSAQLAISVSLSGVNKGEVEHALEECGACVSVEQRERDNTEPQKAAKVNTESNKLGHALGLDSGEASPVVNNIDTIQMQNINKSATSSGVGNSNSEQVPHIFETRDLTGREDKPNLSVKQSCVADETLGTLETLKKPELASQGPDNGNTQGLFNSASDGEASFALVKTYLATVVEDGLDDEMDKGHRDPTGPGRTSTDLTADRSPVKVFVCDVTDDQNQDHGPHSPSVSSHASPGRLAALPVSVRAHLDIPGPSSRPQVPDLHQSPRGFTIISEEEELDAVFVNDTGPMLSPSTRRAKAYPFSLSPIFEEESGREDASREDVLHVPPATEEEQRSVEQQASSILSLLQSVSERLQSSAFSDMEDAKEKLEEVEEPERPQGFLRPLWDRYDHDNDEAAADEQSSLLLHQQLTGIGLHSEGLKPAPGDSALPLSPDQETTRPQEAESGARHHKTNLTNINNVVNPASSPFYQYLKSSIVPAFNTEKQESESVCHNGRSPTSTTLTEMGTLRKASPRPTLLHIYEGTVPSGNRRDVCGDVEDATQVLFPKEATIYARRGCWLLYLKPGYRGPCVVLEEGQTVRMSGDTTESDGPSAAAPFATVGSIRRAVKDDSVPEILLRSINNQQREPVCVHSEVDCVDAHGFVHLSDLSVRSGCWLAYDGAGFTGNHTVVQAGGSTAPALQNSPISCVRSLRPLRMGGLRVQRPLDPKILLYEEPLCQGHRRELLDNTPSLGAEGGLVQVSSLRVAGGVWVGYSCENYRGQQCLLEEGEYSDCTALFSEPSLTLRSCRFLQADFIEPHVSLKNSGEELELVDQDVEDLLQNGLKKEAEAIHVKNGAWVAYSGRHYTGEQCVLEKGQHPGKLDWCGKQSSPLSMRPVRRELSREEEPKFLLCAFSKPSFAGERREFESEVADCGVWSPTSFRVILGSWVLYDEENYCGNQFILGEGLYPDLTSCGCMATTIRSFKPIPYSFSEPSVSLFSLSSFEGLETVADSPMESMEHFFTQSVRVNSGLWVVYEFGQYKGRQMLLQTGEYPCWAEYSSWDTVGSLQPLRQRRMYVQVRSRAQGTALTAEKTLDRLSPAKLLLRPADRSLDSQHWMYSQSLLKSKVGKGCLSVIGGKACVGARVALWEEHGRINQRWSLNENGTVSPHLNHCLVLDRKGGSGIDRDHLILSEVCADNSSQYWDIEVL